MVKSQRFCGRGGRSELRAHSAILSGSKRDEELSVLDSIVEQQKVLVLSYAFPPVAASGTFRVARFVRYLPEFGWRAIVVTPKPEYAIYNTTDPTLRQLIPEDTIVAHTAVLRPLIWAQQWVRGRFSDRSDLDHAKETNSISRAWAMPHASVTPTAPIWRTMARDVRKCLFETPDRHVGWVLPAVRAGLDLIRRHRPQRIFSSGPPHSAHLAAVLLKSLTGIPLVCDLRDPWARNPWQTNEGNLQSAGQRWMERWCVRRADAIVLNTDAARVEFEACYRTNNHGMFFAIPNGYDPDLIPRVAEHRSAFAHIRSNGAIRLCHCGSVYGNRDLVPVVDAIAQLVAGGRDVELWQVGAVGRLEELRAGIRVHGLEQRVTIRGQISHDQALASMAAADVLVILQSGTQLQIPAKVFEMMLFEKPILALTDEGPTADLIRDSGVGVVVDPRSPAAIARAILKAHDHGRNSFESERRAAAIRAFDGRALSRQLANVFGECTR